MVEFSYDLFDFEVEFYFEFFENGNGEFTGDFIIDRMYHVSQEEWNNCYRVSVDFSAGNFILFYLQLYSYIDTFVYYLYILKHYISWQIIYSKLYILFNYNNKYRTILYNYYNKYTPLLFLHLFSCISTFFLHHFLKYYFMLFFAFLSFYMNF